MRSDKLGERVEIERERGEKREGGNGKLKMKIATSPLFSPSLGRHGMSGGTGEGGGGLFGFY